MSVEKVKAFFEKVERDKVLQAKLKALPKTVKKLDNTVIELVKIAEEAGFKFTPSDFASAKAQGSDLSQFEIIRVEGLPGCCGGMCLFTGGGSAAN
jgi:predicted ribosomally synthesized peptide with nif11-like leader